MNENFIMILPEEINKVGIHKALIIAFLRGWLATNATNPIANRAGRTWSFLTLDRWSQMTGVKRGTIKTHLKQLRDRGIVIAGNFNKFGFDRTIWYSLADDYNLQIQEYRDINSSTTSDNIADSVSNDASNTLGESEPMENSNTTFGDDANDTTIQYTNEEINEYSNECTKTIDLVNIPEEVIKVTNNPSNEVEQVSYEEFDEKVEYEKLIVSISNFINNFNQSDSSEELRSFHNCIENIINRYEFLPGIRVIFNFIYKDEIVNDRQIQFHLTEIKSKRNKFLI